LPRKWPKIVVFSRLAVVKGKSTVVEGIDGELRVRASKAHS
jgi:hypothetical protein